MLPEITPVEPEQPVVEPCSLESDQEPIEHKEVEEKTEDDVMANLVSILGACEDEGDEKTGKFKLKLIFINKIFF